MTLQEIYDKLRDKQTWTKAFADCTSDVSMIPIYQAMSDDYKELADGLEPHLPPAPSTFDVERLLADVVALDKAESFHDPGGDDMAQFEDPVLSQGERVADAIKGAMSYDSIDMYADLVPEPDRSEDAERFDSFASEAHLPLDQTTAGGRYLSLPDPPGGTRLELIRARLQGDWEEVERLLAVEPE